ncbi:Immunity protein 50 [Pseudoxanthomonas sp. GM95]|uniref:Imm50 family immunity protein n=1 Tax=Pseudoxanthomonas sp. GM95 TaxID=1881043 RepID=UPI0008D5E49C|nr:Imm50 family immunity protein [Pseudoxanthomonas sp. GM95]SEM12936.1 Immunity protein 50 [Pseudoxanthomonas sp. GM95]
MGRVESIFGYWPEFADGRILALSWQHADQLLLTIDYIDAEQRKRARISLLFSGISNLNLTGLMSENVLDSLEISGEGPVTVHLEACVGLCGSFNCARVEVIEVTQNSVCSQAASPHET